MAIAIFDLDNTLIAGDSDHRWGEFMCTTGRVNPKTFARTNDAFYRDYQTGNLDIHAYVKFALGPIAGAAVEEVAPLQKQFLDEWIEPMLLPAAFDLIDQHRQAGDTLLIITATNTVVTRPIADRLGIKHLLGCEAEITNGRYTGNIVGTPTFREGKIHRFHEWINAHQLSPEGAYFYSDSHNDLPLLEAVDHPVAIDPDASLRQRAEAMGWPVRSLR